MTDLINDNAQLRAALLTCINMLDDLVAESGRGVEYGEEDAFRMGEWFDDHDLMNIEAARAILATPAPDAGQEIVAEAVRQAIDMYVRAEDAGGCGQTAVAMWLRDIPAAIRARGEG